MFVLVGVAFSNQGFLSKCENFEKNRIILTHIVYFCMFIALVLRLFYYCGLHIWSNDIIWSRIKVEKQPEIRIFGISFYNYVEYAWEFNNTWILGKMKRSIKITLLIIPQSWIDQIKIQRREMQEKAEEGINFASWSSLKRSMQMSARNVLNFRKTVAMLCFFPMLFIGLMFPLLIIIILILLIIMMIPCMLLLFVYNLFAKNMQQRRSLDFGEVVKMAYKNRVEELPAEVLCKSGNFISGTESVTSNQIRDSLINKGVLDLHGKRKITEDELKNVVFFVLSLNSKRFNKVELNMNDMKLTDSNLEVLVPMASRFQTLKIGGEQQITENGLQKLTKYLRQRGSKSKLNRLEIHGTKVESFQFAKKAAEEIGAFQGMKEKKELINGICDMLPYLKEVSLNGLLKYSTFDAIAHEAENLSLWSCIKSSNLSVLSLQDCNITDSIIAEGVEGFLKIPTMDLSENPKITSKGWRQFSSASSLDPKLRCLIYQNGPISEASAAAFSDLFFYLTDLDLSRCKFEGASLDIFLKKMQNLEMLSKMKIKTILLTKASLTKQHQDLIEIINKNYEGESLIMVGV